MEGVNSFGCLRNTIKVSSGHYFDLANPDPSMVDIDTIATTLSKTCRFGGHCPGFYSVAEHCVEAANFAFNQGENRDDVIAILMHDASEAYVGDMVKPLKMMLPKFSEIESSIERAIGIRFGIDFEARAGVIKKYDRAMLKAEKMAMWPDDSEEWEGFSKIEAADVHIEQLSPVDAQKKFESWARKLGIH